MAMVSDEKKKTDLRKYSQCAEPHTVSVKKYINPPNLLVVVDGACESVELCFRSVIFFYFFVSWLGV